MPDLKKAYFSYRRIQTHVDLLVCFRVSLHLPGCESETKYTEQKLQCHLTLVFEVN